MITAKDIADMVERVDAKGAAVSTGDGLVDLAAID